MKSWVSVVVLAMGSWACGTPGGGSALDGGGSTGSSTSATASTGSSGSTASSSSGGSSSGSATSSSSSSSGAIVTGPLSVTFSGDPEGLWWDSPSSTLYVVDQENNQILTWTDAASFQLFSVLPGGAQAAEDLGQVIPTAQGYLLVTVFGFGTNGTIDLVLPDAGVVALAGLAPTFRRLGLTQDANGTLYDSHFVKNSSGATYVGTVSQLTVTNTGGTWTESETPMITGLEKPVGVLAVNGTLYVTDQGNSEFLSVLEASLPSAAPTVVASSLSVDLISQGPSGILFTGSTNGDLNEIETAGQETAFASGYAEPRGSAYDAVHNRIFFGNQIMSGGHNQLVIIPGP